MDTFTRCCRKLKETPRSIPPCQPLSRNPHPSAPAPGPMKVPAEKLRSVLGITDVHYVAQNHSLAIVDSPLVSTADAQGTPTSEISVPGLHSRAYLVG